MGNGPTAAVLANEGSILIELDVHAVTVLGQGVIAAQLTVATHRRLTLRALLISITEKLNKRFQSSMSHDRKITFYYSTLV